MEAGARARCFSLVPNQGALFSEGDTKYQFPVTKQLPRDGSVGISCTPHFKDDAETAWVTQDSLTTVSLWLNPDRGLTLEDVAETIEQFVHTMPGFSSQIASCTLQSLVIRGEVFNKDSLMLSAHMAGDKLHDGEQFTVKVVKKVGIGCCVIL